MIEFIAAVVITAVSAAVYRIVDHICICREKKLDEDLRRGGHGY